MDCGTLSHRKVSPHLQHLPRATSIPSTYLLQADRSEGLTAKAVLPSYLPHWEAREPASLAAPGLSDRVTCAHHP